MAVLGDLGVVLKRLGAYWCGLKASWCGLGASSGGLDAVLARLGDQKMARGRFEDLRASAGECDQRWARPSGTQFLMIISFF